VLDEQAPQGQGGGVGGGGNVGGDENVSGSGVGNVGVLDVPSNSGAVPFEEDMYTPTTQSRTRAGLQ